MRTSIKINDQYIQKILLGSTPVQRIYQSGSIVYEAGGSTPCFEVVDTISKASGDYVDVYALDTKKWYKKNNLSQYEKYGVMPIISDLSSMTYYTGKLVVLDTNNHEYKWNGTTWVDLGECEGEAVLPEGYTQYQAIANNGNAYINTGYIPSNKTRILADMQITTSTTYGRLWGSGNWNVARSIQLDYENNTTGTIHGKWGTESTWNVNSNVRGDFNRHVYDMYDHYLYRDGDLVLTFASGTFTSPYNLAIFTYYNYGTPGSSEWINGRLYSFKIYDNGTLVRDFIPCKRDSDSKVGAYDIVNNVFYPSSSSNQFSTYGDPFNPLTPVEEYDEKVAPANNVHYNTLTELELMECPWIGMQATVGSNYIPYLYTVTGWMKQYTPCFEVVYAISKASGDYVDVYVKGESKWYKRNNLSQYEEYGVRPIVTDLSSTTYYTGKLVILSTDNHEYRWTGTEWEDLGSARSFTSYLFADPITSATYSCSYNPKYYFDNNYKLQIFFYVTEGYSYSSDFSMLGSNGTSPIEFSWYSNGFYFDSHYPTSTAGQFNTDDYDNRVMANGQLNNHKGKLLLLEITFNKAVLYDYETGTQLYSSGSIVTKDFQDCGTVLRIIGFLRMNASSPAHIGWLKVFNNNGVVVNDIRPALDANDKLIWHDSIVNADYLSNNSNSFPYHYVSIGELDPPVDYDEKVAPANNVHYDTLAELELMECPWIGMQATIGENNDPYIYTTNGWVPYIPNYVDQYLTIESLVDNNVIMWKNSYLDGVLKLIYYSTDGDVWNKSFSSYNGKTLATLNTGDKLYLKASHITGSWKDHCMFTASGQYNVYGNLLSLIYMDEFADKSSVGSTECFIETFKNTPVVSAENLVIPITAVPDQGLRELFRSCTSLVSADISYIQSAGQYSMMNMFNGCTSLESIKLPSSELTLDTCAFSGAFNGCSSLATDIVLTLSGGYKYVCQNMFNGCTSLKNVTLNITSTANLGSDSAFNRMFYGCTGLENAYFNFYGNLTGTGSTCKEMFYGCSSLSYIKAMPKDINFSGTDSSLPTCNWVSGVAANGTFVKNSQATWNRTGTNGVPSGWAVQTENPPS